MAPVSGSPALSGQDRGTHDNRVSRTVCVGRSRRLSDTDRYLGWGDHWVVGTWPRYFTGHQAITALTIAQRLAAGYGGDDPCHRLAGGAAVSDRLIKITTAVAVATVAAGSRDHPLPARL
jgi:hypothetical protein